MGTLYVVATPIGNLEDASPRALRVLREVGVVAAEDTRHTAELLRHFGIEATLVSLHGFNERSRRDRLLAALADGDVALVSDAGTPGISDPGVDLIDAALAQGFAVRAVAGPSSLSSAVSVSGLVDGPFVFLGFLPRGGGERRRTLARAGVTGFGLVLFETPTRIGTTLDDLFKIVGARRAAVVRELTKMHEQIVRGRLPDLDGGRDRLATRGEIVLVVEGADDGVGADDVPEESLRMLLAAGLTASQAAREAAGITGLPRSSLYEMAIRLKGEEPGGAPTTRRQPG